MFFQKLKWSLQNKHDNPILVCTMLATGYWASSRVNRECRGMLGKTAKGQKNGFDLQNSVKVEGRQMDKTCF